MNNGAGCDVSLAFLGSMGKHFHPATLPPRPAEHDLPGRWISLAGRAYADSSCAIQSSQLYHVQDRSHTIRKVSLFSRALSPYHSQTDDNL